MKSISLVAAPDAVPSDIVMSARRRRPALKRVPAVLRKHPLVWLGVIVPTCLVALYYLLVATPVFVSESKFIVRLSSPPSQSPIGAILQSSGIARSQDDTFSASDFLSSRDALRRLAEREPLREIFAPPEADFLARFPRPWDSDSFEGMYRYFLSRIDVIHNASTGITTLRTRAFSAHHALVLNNELLAAASDLLVRLNNRAREDAVAFSRREVADAEQKLLDVQEDITKFRNNELMIDPTRVSVVMLDMIGRLSTELALTRSRLAEAKASAPDSGAVPSLTSRVAALQEQIDRERLALVGNDASVAAHIADYERLTLKRELANKALTLATTSLETARADARRQQLYLEPIVEPNLPDEAIEPRGPMHVLVVFLLGSVLSLISWVLWMAVAEHRQNNKQLGRFEAASD
ncbi:capsule biosynthesis protein [Bradyrhizobium sp.]|uniref:capsule biosynthesis protein n=1 Tax=Bradyrhizobium sp. TaxID=376 RepID=UPI0039E4BB0B